MRALVTRTISVGPLILPTVNTWNLGIKIVKDFWTHFHSYAGGEHVSHLTHHLLMRPLVIHLSHHPPKHLQKKPPAGFDVDEDSTLSSLSGDYCQIIEKTNEVGDFYL